MEHPFYYNTGEALVSIFCWKKKKKKNSLLTLYLPLPYPTRVIPLPFPPPALLGVLLVLEPSRARLPEPPSFTDNSLPLDDCPIPLPLVTAAASRPKPPPPNTPLLGDDLPPPPLLGDADFMMPSESTPAGRDDAPILRDGLLSAPPREANNDVVRQAGDKGGMVAPRHFAALAVFTRDAPARAEDVGGTTAILPEAGDRATATAAVAAAEAGTLLHFLAIGSTSARPTRAQAAGGGGGEREAGDGDREGEGDDEQPAVEACTGRTLVLPLSVEVAVELSSAKLVVAIPLFFSAEVATVLEWQPTPSIPSGDGGVTNGGSVIDIVTFSRDGLNDWVRCWEPRIGGWLTLAFLEEKDLVMVFRAMPALESWAAFRASRSAIFLASTRAAARSTATSGVRFLESTTPFAVVAGGPRRTPAEAMPPAAAPLFAQVVPPLALPFLRLALLLPAKPP